MLEVVVSGLVTGWAIAIPIGAVGAYLVTLTARTSLRVGAAAALGVATVDGVYAAVAVVAGSAAAAVLEPVAGPLRVASGAVLLGLAAITAYRAVRPPRADPQRAPTRLSPARAWLVFAAVTAVNPATVVYFAAVVLGNRELTSTPVEGVVFVLAAFAASASWQLLLAAGGAALGQAVTGPRGRVATGLVSATVVAGLAVLTMLP